MSDLKDRINQLQAQRVKEGKGKGKKPNPAFTSNPSPRDTQDNTGGVMPEVKPLVLRNSPHTPLSEVGSSRGAMSLQEYMKDRRSGGTAGRAGPGSSASQQTSSSVAQLVTDLNITRKELEVLRKENQDIKALLQKIVTQNNELLNKKK